MEEHGTDKPDDLSTPVNIYEPFYHAEVLEQQGQNKKLGDSAKVHLSKNLHPRGHWWDPAGLDTTFLDKHFIFQAENPAKGVDIRSKVDFARAFNNDGHFWSRFLVKTIYVKFVCSLPSFHQ